MFGFLISVVEWDLHATSTYVMLQDRYFLLSHTLSFRAVEIGRVRLYRLKRTAWNTWNISSSQNSRYVEVILILIINC